jgi:hypothetical protein
MGVSRTDSSIREYSRPIPAAILGYTIVIREARFESAMTCLESEPYRRLQNQIVEQTPLFDLFL